MTHESGALSGARPVGGLTRQSRRAGRMLEDWQMTCTEYEGGPVCSVGKRQIRAERRAAGCRHQRIVRQALADGKPVPERVLAGYPYLRKQEG